MFVASGARLRLLIQRRERFAAQYVAPLVTEAGRLGIGTDELITLVRQSSRRSPSPRKEVSRYDAAHLGNRPHPPLP